MPAIRSAYPLLDAAEVPAPSPYGADDYDAAALSADQLAGLACVVCDWPGGVSLLPVGQAVADGEPVGQVFACADCSGVTPEDRLPDPPKRSTPRKRRRSVATVRLPDPECRACGGVGTVEVSVSVGRRGMRREVGEQMAVCMVCGGAGTVRL